MIQDVLDDPDWDGVLTAEDERGLTPLFWSHVLLRRGQTRHEHPPRAERTADRLRIIAC